MTTILLRINVPEGGEGIIRELLEANDLQAEIMTITVDELNYLLTLHNSNCDPEANVWGPIPEGIEGKLKKLV